MLNFSTLFISLLLLVVVYDMLKKSQIMRHFVKYLILYIYLIWHDWYKIKQYQPFYSNQYSNCLHQILFWAVALSSRLFCKKNLFLKVTSFLLLYKHLKLLQLLEKKNIWPLHIRPPPTDLFVFRNIFVSGGARLDRSWTDKLLDHHSIYLSYKNFVFLVGYVMV